MSQVEIKVPDIGTDQAVEIVEVCVAEGDSVEIDESLVVLETDKATFEVPSTHSGVIAAMKVAVGDKVSEGDLIALMDSEAAADAQEESAPVSDVEEANNAKEEPEEKKSTAASESVVPSESSEQDILLPNTGSDAAVTVVEVAVQPGQTLQIDDTVVVVESDKATMEIPSPFDGEVLQVNVKEGDQVSEGALLALVKAEGASGESPTASRDSAAKTVQEKPEPSTKKTNAKPAPVPETSSEAVQGEPSDQNVHAGPAVRKLARELGADLSRVKPSGPRNRILKEDLHAYIKQQVELAQSGGGASAGEGIPKPPLPDFSSFGEVEAKPMSKIHRLTATNMQTSWLNIPHVTQFDEADITGLEEFRKSNKGLAESKGLKLTPMPFLLKACAYALKELSQFNVSLDMDAEQVIHKKYINIGMAVDTPAGLVVPVIKDVDKKGIWELAQETVELAGKARDRKLTPSDMQGGCFTISSLGSIGGTAFTPIVNLPEVAILGVSKSQFKPVFNGKEFEPRLMLPLSLSYDHRAINGADAARFTALLATVLGDIRHMLL